MDDDWDLEAVVRGCAATVTTTGTDSTVAENPIPCYNDNEESFDFYGLGDDRNDPFEGLQEIYREFCGDDPPPTTAAADISSTGIMSVQPAPFLQPHQHTMQIKPPLRLNMQIQENVQLNVSPMLGAPPQNFPASIPQPIRPRRRKNQQMRIVRQMTQDELSADSWAWRKYGQKPIKGSPYPRNYYRCSTSKGCAARKQVERSPNDSEIFVVSYSGEHTHPRPTHRSSLAGSSRSKLASPPAKSGGCGSNTTAILSQKVLIASSSSPAAGSSFSPATPSVEGEAAAQNDEVQMAEEDDDDDDDNLIMITNDLMNDDDDMFRGFEDSGDHLSRGGGEFFSSGLL